MAVEDLGISRSERDSSHFDSIKVFPGSTTDALFVKWRTQFGDEQRFANVAVAWRGVARGDVAAGMDYGDWEQSDVDASVNGRVAWYYRRFPVSELWRSSKDQDGPGFWWAAPLSFTSTDPTTVDYRNVAERICGGDWSYSSRRWDAVWLHVKVRMEYALMDDEGDPVKDEAGNEVLQSAPLEERDLYVGWVPDYHAQSASLTRSGLEIAYGSPGWARSSDRWALDSGLASSGGTVVSGKRYGTLAAHGRILIPASMLSRDPAGEALRGTVRMNATWRPADLPFARMSLDGVVVSDLRTANTPTIAATADQAGRSVTVRVGDSGDLGVPLESVEVRMVGAEWEFDRAELAPGGSHTFRLPPLGVTTMWEATGYGAGGAVSRSVRASARAIEPGAARLLLEPVDGSARPVELLYNVTEQSDDAPESQSVKLAGRPRPSAFFGEGGTSTHSLACDICEAAVPGLVRQTASEFRALAFCGPCALRRADGSRVALCVDSVSVSRDVQPSFVRKVSLSCSEVS